MKRVVAGFIAATYVAFGAGFWSMYNWRLAKAGETIAVPNNGFATSTIDLGKYGQAPFAEKGNEKYINISLPDGWVDTDEISVDSSSVFKNKDTVAVFSGYCVPKDAANALSLIDQMMAESANAQRSENMTEDDNWYIYQEAGDEDLKAGKEMYYVHLEEKDGATYVTVATAYLPSYTDSEKSVSQLLSSCELT